MAIYTASKAREKLFQLVDYVAESHEPIYVVGKRNTAVILSEEDFRSIQETLYLMSLPGMAQSILQADQEPIEQCKEEIEW